MFAACQGKYCNINGAPIGHLVDENMRKERAMLAQANTKAQVPLADSNGKPDNSCGSDAQDAKIQKELTFAQKENAMLKNQLHQAKDSLARERAERGSKGKKDSQDHEVGSKRPSQQVKQAQTSKQEPSPPTPQRKGV